jgi:hypothetical protein
VVLSEVQIFCLSTLVVFQFIRYASYISVNIKIDVMLNATQVVTVYFATVETVSNSLCTEEIVLIDVAMSRVMSVGWSNAYQLIVFLYPVIQFCYIYFSENKWTVNSFVSKKNDRNIFSVFI